jgi:hypothetical protein
VRAASALLLAASCACAARDPAAWFVPSQESPREKAAQTRLFETSDERELLSASAAVLQDLGFQIEESVREVGLLRATKERSAREYGQEIGRVFALLLSIAASFAGGNALFVMPVDLHQKIAAALVTRPLDPQASRHEVRITFYRVVWKGDGQSGNTYIPPGAQKAEMIRDPEIYQQFFASLAKAVFLEAHRI